VSELDAYFRAVEDVDAAAATGLVLALLEQGTPVERITAEVLAPAQVRVGQRWERGQWSVADEHAATAVTEAALAALTAAAGRRPLPLARHVLVACAEGEWHALPARMAATLAGSSGDRVTVLGPALPAEQLQRRLEQGDVDLVALSCTLATNLVGAARSVAAAHAAGVPVVAGGLAFGTTPLRAYAVGADAWAPDVAGLRSLRPDLVGRPTVIPTQVLLLEQVGDAALALAEARVRGALGSGQVTPDEAVEHLRHLARAAAAALLTRDPSVLDEAMGWIGAVGGCRLRQDVMALYAHVLADTVEPEAPAAAVLLRRAADGLAPARAS
jgi:methanogenic corrinoid protein MtbC1